MTFSNMPESDITGQVNWFKPFQGNAKFYPVGFAYSVDAVGSLFTNASPVLNFKFGSVVVYGDPLAVGVTNQVILGASNHVTNDSPNALADDCDQDGNVQRKRDGSEFEQTGPVHRSDISEAKHRWWIFPRY